MKNAILAFITGSSIAGGAWLMGYHTGQIDGGVAVYRNAQRSAEKRYDAQLRSDDRVREIVASTSSAHASIHHGHGHRVSFLYNGYSIHIYADAKGTHVELSEVC